MKLSYYINYPDIFSNDYNQKYSLVSFEGFLILIISAFFVFEPNISFQYIFEIRAFIGFILSGEGLETDSQIIDFHLFQIISFTIIFIFINLITNLFLFRIKEKSTMYLSWSIIIIFVSSITILLLSRINEEIQNTFFDNYTIFTTGIPIFILFILVSLAYKLQNDTGSIRKFVLDRPIDIISIAIFPIIYLNAIQLYAVT